MDYIAAIQSFTPANEQEAADQAIILSYSKQHPDTVLCRENLVAHITSSGFIMNRQLTKVLLVHHNIRGVWAWTGGHADGDPDLLHVAVKEAKEETGAGDIRPLADTIVSLDVLPVFSHWRRNRFVSAHLHLSAAYILLCDERESLSPRPSENTGVAWFDTEYFTPQHFDRHDTVLYNKLIQKARML